MAVENRADQGASPCSVAEADVYLRADLVLYQQPKARAGRIRGIQEYLTTAATTSLHYIRERKMRTSSCQFAAENCRVPLLRTSACYGAGQAQASMAR